MITKARVVESIGNRDDARLRVRATSPAALRLAVPIATVSSKATASWSAPARCV
jgi:hypothetical protein